VPARHVDAHAVRAAGLGLVIIAVGGGAFVHVLLAERSGEARRTGAFPGAAAHTAVITGRGAHR
jgi:hypothetical protein